MINVTDSRDASSGGDVAPGLPPPAGERVDQPNGGSSLHPVDVAVNLLWCVPGDVGGSEEYLVRQLLGLAATRSAFVPTLYCLRSFVDAHPELAKRYEMVASSLDGARRSRRVLAEHGWLARRTGDADIVHHGGGTVPRRRGRAGGGSRVVLTIHDIQYETYPQYFGRTKLRYLRTVVPPSVRAADVVAVPSGYVRSTLLERFDVDPDRVVVVPHGVEPTLGAGAPDGAELRRRYRLGNGPVLVLPAITHPHKGHRFLLDVMARHWDDRDLRLVLLGGPGLADREVAAAVVELGLSDRVVRPGRVPAADRDGLIALADALVFPSEYEGFGAPVVEAMALGTPVVCSDQAALAEVVGDAGIVLPRDTEAWADALDVVSSRGAELRAAGRIRAQAFTTAASGAALARAYALAVER